jgi:hypothetical protein
LWGKSVTSPSNSPSPEKRIEKLQALRLAGEGLITKISNFSADLFLEVLKLTKPSPNHEKGFAGNIFKIVTLLD